MGSSGDGKLGILRGGGMAITTGKNIGIRNIYCMVGREFRGQTDAKKGRKGRVPEAARESLNRSLVWGKTCAQAKTESKQKHGCPGGGPSNMRP